MTGWVLEWTRKEKKLEEKQEWYTFVKKFVPTATIETKTETQSCHVKWKDSIEKHEKKLVETMIVWNGNGIRARWAGKSELKELVKTSNPDVLCFLEGKTDIDNLLKLEGFDEWIRETGYKHLYCYCSKKEFGANVYGNEGIVLFSKVECEKITYGTGHPEMDRQARVMTAEFADNIMIFTYNPQGGFEARSLEYRKNWEAEMSRYLEKMTLES